MKKKTILVSLVSGLIGFVAGVAFWYLAGPLFFDQEVNESISASDAQAILAEGAFKDADSLHKGTGRATIFEGEAGRRTLRFTDFRVTNGPALEVWLVEKADIGSSEDVENGAYVSLGRLKGNVGDQNYDIPADVDLSKYASVVIWCEQFSVLFSPATLAAPAS